MKKTLSTHDIAHALSSNKDNGFSYHGALALAERLEEYEDEEGEEQELDTVAIRCGWDEYESAYDAAIQYGTFQDILDDKQLAGEILTIDEREQLAIEYLEDNTTVIPFEGGVIIQAF